MGQVRIEKVQELMKHEISRMILQELKDPRIGFVTVTQVEVTGDLRMAKIYVSFMGNEKDAKLTLQGLQSSLGYIRRELGKRIRLRYVPEISFVPDESLMYSEHIQKLLNEVEAEESGEEK